MRVLVTGAAGQLGTDLVTACLAAGDEVHAFDRARLDISDAGQVAEAVEAARPDVIFNCAAWTAVDACEADVDRAMAVNATAVGFLSDAAAHSGAHLVQVSTDYVFDGTKPEPYHEGDTTNPQSVYGSSKLAGEAAAGVEACIVRTSWVCGEHGANMVKTILRLAESHPELRFVSDQRGHPTFTADLAATLRTLGAARSSGVYHVTNQGAVSWFEFTQAVFEAAGFDPGRVHPVATADLDPPRPAPRPANSVLENRRLSDEGHELLRDFRLPLAEVVAALTT